jgi:hypothetical protein
LSDSLPWAGRLTRTIALSNAVISTVRFFGSVPM